MSIENPPYYNLADLAPPEEMLPGDVPVCKILKHHHVSAPPKMERLPIQEAVRSPGMRYSRPFVRAKRPLVPQYKSKITGFLSWIDLQTGCVDKQLLEHISGKIMLSAIQQG